MVVGEEENRGARLRAVELQFLHIWPAPCSAASGERLHVPSGGDEGPEYPARLAKCYQD